MKLVDMRSLEVRAERRVGSSPIIPTNLKLTTSIRDNVVNSAKTAGKPINSFSGFAGC